MSTLELGAPVARHFTSFRHQLLSAPKRAPNQALASAAPRRTPSLGVPPTYRHFWRKHRIRLTCVEPRIRNLHHSFFSLSSPSLTSLFLSTSHPAFFSTIHSSRLPLCLCQNCHVVRPPPPLSLHCPITSYPIPSKYVSPHKHLPHRCHSGHRPLPPHFVRRLSLLFERVLSCTGPPPAVPCLRLGPRHSRWLAGSGPDPPHCDSCSSHGPLFLLDRPM